MSGGPGGRSPTPSEGVGYGDGSMGLSVYVYLMHVGFFIVNLGTL